jgi:radical SAM protein with 4Fe4S-binding SPASM domain
MSNAEHKLPAVKEPIKEGCNYPYYAFFMDYTGEVLLCPHDWSKRLIVGNVTEQRFDEIWTSEVIESIRERLNLKDRNYAPCNLCDVQGLLMGSTHYKKWLELRN